MSEVTNEVLSAKQDALAQRLEKMEIKLDNYAGNFITHEVFELRMKELELRISALTAEVNRLLSQRWLQNTLSAILGSVLTGTVGYILFSVFNKGK